MALPSLTPLRDSLAVCGFTLQSVRRSQNHVVWEWFEGRRCCAGHGVSWLNAQLLWARRIPRCPCFGCALDSWVCVGICVGPRLHAWHDFLYRFVHIWRICSSTSARRHGCLMCVLSLNTRHVWTCTFCVCVLNVFAPVWDVLLSCCLLRGLVQG